MKRYQKKDGSWSFVDKCHGCGKRRVVEPRGGDGEEYCRECRDEHNESERDVLRSQTRRMRRGDKYYA